MKIAAAVLALVLATSPIAGSPAYGLDDGLARTPTMGWNSWYSFFDEPTAETIKQQADALVTTGLRDAGYRMVGIDGGWWTPGKSPGRDSNGNIVPDPDFFAGTSFTGMRQLTDYLHDRGFRAGIYVDTGPRGCSIPAYYGSGGHEVEDARQFAAWGFDFVKLDHCGGNVNGRTTEQSYAAWRDAVATTGRPMELNVANWGEEHNFTWARDVGHSWRTSVDMGLNGNPTWDTVLRNFDESNHPGVAGPGAWNDPDYLLLQGFGLSPTEERSYYGMWAILAAPLILATDLTRLNQTTRDIIANPEVIAVNQDAAGVQGVIATDDRAGHQVLSKKLSTSGSRAVLLLNRTGTAAQMSVNWSDLGLSGNLAIRDLWSRTDLAPSGTGYSATVPAHGTVLLRVSGGTEVGGTLPVGTFWLQARHSGKVAVTLYASPNEGERLVQFFYSPEAPHNDRWTIEPVGNGYARIVNMNSGYVMAVQYASPNAGEVIVQARYSLDTPNDEWRFEPTGDGYYRIVNRHSGLALDVWNADAGDGAPLIQWPVNGGTNQHWQLIGV